MECVKLGRTGQVGHFVTGQTSWSGQSMWLGKIGRVKSLGLEQVNRVGSSCLELIGMVELVPLLGLVRPGLLIEVGRVYALLSVRPVCVIGSIGQVARGKSRRSGRLGSVL